MSFLNDEELDTLRISRMIFHVVGSDLDEATLLGEIAPPQFADFFLERIRSALKGNLFSFRERSSVEHSLRQIIQDADSFVARSQDLAIDFHSRHTGTMSTGVFFVFELRHAGRAAVFAIVKYDNEDVVRYVLEGIQHQQAPRLERFRESFVRKADAMQKVALIRLDDGGGQVIVRDRSNTAHISDYFEGFLQVKRVNSPDDLTGKLVDALKKTFKHHRTALPQGIQRNGVARIHEILRQGGHRFGPEDCEPLITAIFGPLDQESPVRRSLRKNLRDAGVGDETFEINPAQVARPRRYRLETQEGTHILFDEDQRPAIEERADGRREIRIITAGVIRDDIDIETNSRRDQ